MTNRNEAAGTTGNSDISGQNGWVGVGCGDPAAAYEDRERRPHPDRDDAGRRARTECGDGEPRSRADCDDGVPRVRAAWDDGGPLGQAERDDRGLRHQPPHGGPAGHGAAPDKAVQLPGHGAVPDKAVPLTGHGAGTEGTAPAMGHGAAVGPGGEQQVTLRTPAELADALPYLLGYRPEDSIVLVALHDGAAKGRFGGRARLGIPHRTDDWPSAAQQLAHGLVTGSERRGAKPESMVAFLCQDPAVGESARDVMERLRPLAQLLRRACGALDVPVVEALCISDGRFWSYCCPGNGCCSPDGESMGLPGTSVLAAAATYAGLHVRGTLRELRARLLPWETAAALCQEAALDTAQAALVPRILEAESRAEVAEETLAAVRRAMERLAAAPTTSGGLDADLRDDELIGHDDAATMILGLQDRATRDRAAEWMEGDEAGPALRLWRALARRCVGPYGEHAAAPLTLAGWVAWSTGDELEAREALALALAADRDYLFARLLHQACNEGLDPESIRRCLRAERRGRERPTTTTEAGAEGGPEAAEQPSAPTHTVAAAPGDDVAPAGKPCGTGSRRRRRSRPERSPDTRAGRRAPDGTAQARRPRSTEGTSPGGRRSGRPADGPSGRARAHRGADGQDTPPEATHVDEQP
ncbi:DUF4192 domain-containing protein [Streptomyces heilongjiangensis]|nr:DUF4192 domain-containing protein [Streptomyces heilongjiangensis]MDC2949002.1 DUF4192 family protein [Streptomyces heilongjiangensis]